MHTQCPHCQTVFDASKDELRRAQGMVRCGKCYEVFDAPLAKINQKKGVRSARSSHRTKEIKKAMQQALVDADVNHPHLIISALLGLLIVVQLIYLNFNTLNQNPSIRSFFHHACATVGCTVPHPHSVGKIAIVQQAMSTAADSNDILVVTIRLQNQSVFHPKRTGNKTVAQQSQSANQLRQPYLPSRTTCRIKPRRTNFLTRLKRAILSFH